MFGAWHFIHGHSGSIEESESVGSVQRKGWGLSFWQHGGTSNWIHFAVPSNAQYGWKVDHIHLKFSAGEFAKVSEIHLWDGNVQIWQQSVEFAGGEIDVMLPLGKEFDITRALGLSVKIEAGAAGDAHFMFHAVGANFRQTV